VREFQFDRVGVFRYSQEEGTRSARQPDQVPEIVKRDRHNRLMAIQQEISRARMASQVGRVVPVVIEGLSEESDLLLQGRTYGQAPDVDGVTYFGEGCEDARPGDFRMAEIIDAGDYDFVARVLPR
jgi:ribosomal protein S12 methylthiotransferase